MKETDPDREEIMPTAAPEQATSQPAYTIDSTEDEVVVRFRRATFSDEQIARIIAVAELEAIRQKSQLTEEAARELADEVDQAVWEKNRHRVSSAG